MKLLIDTGKAAPSNGNGYYDYTRYVVDGSINVQDSINVPTLLTFHLTAIDNSFVAPPRSCYVKIESEIFKTSGGDPKPFATGFVTNQPSSQYLGLNSAIPGQDFQQLDFTVNVTSDEWLLNCQVVPYIPAFVNKTDSQILAAIADALMPGFFDTTNMASGTLIPFYEYNPSQTWSDIAKTFGDANRYWYKVIDKKIYYQPFGSVPLGISYDENTQAERQLNPTQLTTNVVNVPPVNDCIVIGDTEPQDNVDTYLCGDGFTSNFQLTHPVFEGSSSNLLQDDWTESAFQTGNWIVNDPLRLMSLADSNGNAIGALNIVSAGATGTVYTPIQDAEYILAQNGVELGGGLNLQHGQFTFNDSAARGGVIGGLYTEASDLSPGHCLAGFFITGQPGIGSFTVISVSASGSNNQVFLTISGQNTQLSPGNVFSAAGFTSATFLNGQRFYILSIQQNVDNYVLTCAAENRGIVPVGYGPTSDSGTITFSANAVINTASGSAGIYITPLFNGSVTGSSVISQVNHQYVLQTWIGAEAPNRYTRPFSNLTGTATYGAQNLVASGTISWVITDYNIGNYVIQEQNPLFGLFPNAVPPVVTKFSVFKTNLPPFALYVLVSFLDMNISVNYTDLSIPPQGYLTVQSLTGASGGHLPWLPSELTPPIVYQLGFGMINQTAQISQQGQVFALSFYTDDIPSVGARIRFQSWAAGQSIARVRNLGAIATEAKVSGDSGVRSAILTNISPLPRTSDECEAAAAANITDTTNPQFQGSYTVDTQPYDFESLYNSSLYDYYPHTGLFFWINSPIRGVSGQNFALTSVTMQVKETRGESLTISLDYGYDSYLEKQLPYFIEYEQNLLSPQQTAPAPNPITIDEVLNAYLPTLDSAQVTVINNSLTGNYIVVDLSGGTEQNALSLSNVLSSIGATGCEVRYIDSGWGTPGKGRVGIFTVDQFTLPRTVRDQTFYLRGINGNKYSRFSKALRVVYPLVPSAPTLVNSNASSIIAGLSGDVRDIYGLELRALAASGITGNLFINIPANNTNPQVSCQRFIRGTFGGTFAQMQPYGFAEKGLTYYAGGPNVNSGYQLTQSAPTTIVGGVSIPQSQPFNIGDVIYATDSLDSSFDGFRIIGASGCIIGYPEGVFTGPFSAFFFYYTYDYNQPIGAPFGYPYGYNIYTSQGSFIQLISRGTSVPVISGGLTGGIATVKTSQPHNMSPGMTCVVGASYSPGYIPTFIAPYSHDFSNPSEYISDTAIFTGTFQVASVIDNYTFTYNIDIQGGVQNASLVGFASYIPGSLVENFNIPGAAPGTILQRVVTAPSDLVIDLTQPDLQAIIKYLQSFTPGSRIGGLELYFFNLTWDYSPGTFVPTFVAPTISGLTVDVNSQNIIWTVVGGLPNGHRVLTQHPTTGLTLSKYTVDHPDNPQLLTQSPLPFGDWLEPRVIIVTPFDALGDGIPSVVVWGGSSGVAPIGVSGGLAPGLLGDIVRYNVNGDNQWDNVNYSQQYFNIWCGHDGIFVAGLAEGTSVGTAGTATVIWPTSTIGFGREFGTGTASTTTVGIFAPQNGNNSELPMLAFYRLTMKFQIPSNTGFTNTRFWLGLCNWNNGSGTGNNAVSPVGTTVYAADLPNKTTLGFRFSSSTDTHWQAVSIVAGGTPTSTVIDTGVTPDNNIHTFEITMNYAGTQAQFWMDGVLVATISSPLVSPSADFDALASIFWTADNKNTATIVNGIMYYANISLR